MDNKQGVGAPDRDRINIHEDYEVKYWTRKFNVSKERLVEAVRTVGTSAEDVLDYLSK